MLYPDGNAQVPGFKVARKVNGASLFGNLYHRNSPVYSLLLLRSLACGPKSRLHIDKLLAKKTSEMHLDIRDYVPSCVQVAKKVAPE